MNMTPPTFQVLVAPPGEGPADLEAATEHTVQVLTGDQLRAELEAGQLGLPLEFKQAPTHHTALWLWAALSRMGVTDAKFKDFQPRLLLVKSLQDQAVAVDPTQPAPPTAGP